ncbi:hypothetical protein CEXT_458541 [Caerostris extrusa]|uniref:Uncharacterized protein n=1 Tax=Caerostris extrusa TaxID=172846 RepID=A0AAV4NY93_CAEEX|nr:hypothetical protein CEXT_458541 [Caerostris extrusa]
MSNFCLNCKVFKKKLKLIEVIFFSPPLLPVSGNLEPIKTRSKFHGGGQDVHPSLTHMQKYQRIFRMRGPVCEDEEFFYRLGDEDSSWKTGLQFLNGSNSSLF